MRIILAAETLLVKALKGFSQKILRLSSVYLKLVAVINNVTRLWSYIW